MEVILSSISCKVEEKPLLYPYRIYEFNNILFTFYFTGFTRSLKVNYLISTPQLYSRTPTKPWRHFVTSECPLPPKFETFRFNSQWFVSVGMTKLQKGTRLLGCHRTSTSLTFITLTLLKYFLPQFAQGNIKRSKVCASLGQLCEVPASESGQRTRVSGWRHCSDHQETLAGIITGNILMG